MTALDKLFQNEEPKAAKVETKVEAKKAIETVAVPSPGKQMKVCPTCSERVWPFNLREDGCTQCVKSKKRKKKTTKTTPKVTKPKPTEPVETAVKAKTHPKSDKRQRGIESEHWHNDPATYKQTSFLKKATGLKTWDLETPITKYTASVLIGEIKKGNGGVKDATKLLMDHHGCVKYVRPEKKVKSAAKRGNPSASSNVDRDTAAELVAMKRTIRELEAKLAEAS